MKIALSLGLLAVLLVPACRMSPDHINRDPYYGSPSVAPRGGGGELRDLGAADIESQLSQSELVFNGEVLEVGKSSGVGSGIAVVTQPVAYRITRVIKGVASADRIVVHHVIAGGATADPSNSTRLNPAIFREGARLLVWAKRSPAPDYPGQERWVNLWETPGPVLSAGHASTRIRAFLEK